MNHKSDMFDQSVMFNQIKAIAALCSALFLTTLPPPANAAPRTDFVCESANYRIGIFKGDKGIEGANYAINGVVNEGADVEITQGYLSDRALAFQLRVDGQKNFFELIATRNGDVYTGSIYTKKFRQYLTCKEGSF
jgi:hypothetical protein